MSIIRQRTFDRGDLTISELGFGGAGIGNLFRPISNAQAQSAIDCAWQQGVRYFDTAPHYGSGLSERRLGLAVHELPRQQLLLSSKVGRLLSPIANTSHADGECYMQAAPFQRIYDYSYDGVMRSFEDSLQRMGVSQIDILYMHDIGRLTHGEAHEAHFTTAMEGGHKAMVALREQGLVKAIGLGVNEWEVCNEALDHADFDCFMVANCFTLLNNSITEHFTDRCRSRQTSLVVAAPFNSGVLAKGSAGAGHYFYGDTPDAVIQQVRALEEVCQAFHIPLQAAAIQFPLLYSCVKTVVVGMTHAERIKQNLSWYHQPIPAEFWDTLVQQGHIRAFG